MSWANGIWAGFGFESGGEVIFGIGKQTGFLFSMQDFTSVPRLTRWCLFQQQSATIGLGLGGAAGVNFVVGYNAAVPSDFDGASVDFDFSIDLVLGGLNKYFRNLPEMVELVAMVRKFDRNVMKVADAMKKYETNPIKLKTITENLVKNHAGVREALKNQASLISFPLPVVSGGLRLSLKMKAEETTVLSFDAMDLSKSTAHV
ncbi:hypothetical protein [Roseomonas sp. WA12]